MLVTSQNSVAECIEKLKERDYYTDPYQTGSLTSVTQSLTARSRSKSPTHPPVKRTVTYGPVETGTSQSPMSTTTIPRSFKYSPGDSSYPADLHPVMSRDFTPNWSPPAYNNSSMCSRSHSTASESLHNGCLFTV